MDVPQKTKQNKKTKIELPYDLAIPFLGIDLKKMETLIQSHIHFNVHSNIIYNCQDMEAT